MINQRIVTSWDKIAPSDSTDRRILSVVVERNHALHEKRTENKGALTSKVIVYRCGLIAVCIFLTIVAVKVVRILKRVPILPNSDTFGNHFSAEETDSKHSDSVEFLPPDTSVESNTDFLHPSGPGSIIILETDSGLELGEGPDASNTEIPITETFRIQMNDIFFNELKQKTSFTGNGCNTEECITERWNKEELANCYGCVLIPPYLPVYLIPGSDNVDAEFMLIRTAGDNEYDTAIRFYYEKAGDDQKGIPVRAEDDLCIRRGLSLSASKNGLLAEADFILQDDGIRKTFIGETEVTFGCLDISYVSCDPDTERNAGQYEYVEAGFSLSGTTYLVEAWGINRVEFVRIVASVIIGTDNIRID